jgi:geranylgeranyl diphosphate synthase type I
VLRRRLGDPALDPAGVDDLREIIVSTSALQHVEALIDALTDQAFRALDAADVTDTGREVLRGLAVAATARAT